MLRGFVAGIGKHFATPVSVTLNDVATTTQALATAFGAVIAADEAVQEANAKRAAAIAAANALAEGIVPQAKAFKSFVLTTFGGNPATLADFDVKPHKVAVVSTAARSAAAKKAEATRKALGTLGAAQKRKAKKQLEAQQVVAAAPAPAAPSPEPTPAVTPVAAPPKA
jgi:hypothetical protein